MISPTWWCRHGATVPDDQDTKLHCLGREENIQSLVISNFRPTNFNESFQLCHVASVGASVCHYNLQLLMLHSENCEVSCVFGSSIWAHRGVSGSKSTTIIIITISVSPALLYILPLLIRGRPSHAETANIPNYIDTIRHSLYSKLPKSSKKGTDRTFSAGEATVGKLTVIT